VIDKLPGIVTRDHPQGLLNELLGVLQERFVDEIRIDDFGDNRLQPRFQVGD